MRICISRPFYRRLSTQPPVIFAIASSLVAYPFLIISLAIYFPIYLRWLTVLTGGAFLFLLWHVRPNYGITRGLPAGSLMSARFWSDPFFYQRLIDRYGSVFKTRAFASPVVGIFGLEQGGEFLRSNEKHLLSPPLPFSDVIPGGFIRYMDHEVHQKFRNLFRTAFSPKIIENCTPFAIQTVQREFSEMAQKCSPQLAGISAQPYLGSLFFTIFAKIFYGFEPNSEQFARIKTLNNVLRIHNRFFTPSKKVIKTLEEISAVLCGQFEQFSKNEAKPGCFLEAIWRKENEITATPTVLWNLIYIMQVALTDFTGLLEWILKMLCNYPEWSEKVREESNIYGAKNSEFPLCLADRIVWETLRLERSEYIMRETQQKIEFRGFTIPKGWLVRICVRESHRDPKNFENPNDFNPDRFLSQNYPRTEYSPFGVAKVYCLGEYLSKVLARIFIHEISHGFDMRIAKDGPPRFDGFHWQPNPKFRITISARLPEEKFIFTG